MKLLVYASLFVPNIMSEDAILSRIVDMHVPDTQDKFIVLVLNMEGNICKVRHELSNLHLYSTNIGVGIGVRPTFVWIRISPFLCVNFL